MKFVSCVIDGKLGLAVESEAGLLGLSEGERPGFAVDLLSHLAAGRPALGEAEAVLKKYGRPLDASAITFLPPIARPPKIICIGVNYVDHAAEGNVAAPTYPPVFGRFASSLTGHGQTIVRPTVSGQLDFEGELVAYIGRGGRHIGVDSALEHVAGYSICNEASIRDFQFKSSQWTVGKNFDQTGAIGPYFVSADELPPGAKGLKLQTLLNGVVVQSASTQDMIFDVATLVSLLSEAMTLEAGDTIITGTPAGVGWARNPPLWMKDGDTVEVSIEGIGVLRNGVRNEAV